MRNPLTSMFKAIHVPQYFKSSKANTVTPAADEAGHGGVTGTPNPPSSANAQSGMEAARHQRRRFSLTFGRKKKEKRAAQADFLPPGGVKDPAFQKKLALLRNRPAPDVASQSNTAASRPENSDADDGKVAGNGEAVNSEEVAAGRADEPESPVSGEDLRRLFREEPGTAAPGSKGLRARLAQMLDTKAVPHPPAERFEGNWETAVAQNICQRWVDSQQGHNASSVSLIAMSKVKALEYERKNRESIPEEQRLLPPSSKKQDYYAAEVMAFLEAVGETNPEAVLKSFKQTGTGGLHRQHVVATATFSNVVGGVAALVPDLTAKAVLSGVRLALQGVAAERIADSGWRRLRNAGTEDMLPLGRADAAPSAKQAPSVFQASSAVISELRGAGNNLRRMETALDALDQARNAYAANPRENNRQALTEARNKLELAYAKACYQMSVKAAYKASSESTKIEFRGNQRQFAASYAGGSLTVGAGLLSILTPAVLAAPVTGGISLGAVAAAATLYVGYQLSNGPSKDGEAKAKRAIVALAKSGDLLSADNLSGQKKRGDAYKAHIQHLRRLNTWIQLNKADGFSPHAARAEAKKEATEKLLARLAEITQEERGAAEPMDLRQNWEAYHAHRTAVSNIEAEGGTQEEVSGKIKELEEQFQAAHKSDFNAKNVADAWKTPMRMRMDSAGRLLKGKVAQSHKRLINLTRHNIKNDKALKELKQELAKNLRDMFNLELALAQLKPLAEGKEAAPDAMARAAEAIGAIQDEDVRSVFCGDARQQVEATNKAKILTAGEAQRYTYITAGSAAANIALNLGVAVVDVGLNTAKATHSVAVGLHNHDPKDQGKVKIPEFNDYKFAAVTQTSTQPAAHLAAGDRAAFQKREMKQLRDVTANDSDPVTLRMDLADDGQSHLDKNDIKVAASIEALIARLWNMNSVPEKIALSLKPQSPEAPAKDISVDMTTTSAYQRVRYKDAPLEKKLKSNATQAGILGRQTAMSVFGLPAQAIAQYTLNKTRAPLNQSAALGQRIRQSLTDAAQPEATAESAAETTARLTDEEVRSLAEDAGRPETGNVAQTELEKRDKAASEIALKTGRGTLASLMGLEEELRELERSKPVRRVTSSVQSDLAAWAASRSASLHGQDLSGSPAASGASQSDFALRASRELLDTLKAATPATDAWFGENDLQVVHNDGNQNNCLILSLLQHATGLYEGKDRKRLTDLANDIRREFDGNHPGIRQGSMLEVFPGHDDPLLREITGMIQSRLANGGIAGIAGRLNPVVVMPHESGVPISSGGVAPMSESEINGLGQQHMIVYGRNGALHFEAVRA